MEGKQELWGWGGSPVNRHPGLWAGPRQSARSPGCYRPLNLRAPQEDGYCGKEPSTVLGPGPPCLLEAGTSDSEGSHRACGGVPAVGVEASPSPVGGHSFRSHLPLPWAVQPFSRVLFSRSRSFPSPLLLLGVEIAFQLPFAFPINPDSAIKPAGGAGREAAAGTGPLGAVASAPLPFRPRLLPAPPCAAGRPGREREPLELLLPPWNAGRAREQGTGGWGRRALPAQLLCRSGLALCGSGRRVRGEGSGRQAGRRPSRIGFSPQARRSSHAPAAD